MRKDLPCIVLPPKRFDNPGHYVYDQIRHKDWFPRLYRRRSSLSNLKLAWMDWQKGLSQKAAANEWAVDERELRDYSAFVGGVVKPCPHQKLFQYILDQAYMNYCADNADHSIRYWIDMCSDLTEANSRHVIEKWETDPAFFPTNYSPKFQ